METVRETTPKPKSKNRNTPEYIRNYMRKKYLENPLKSRKYQRSREFRRKYNIPDTINDVFGNDIFHIIKIHHLIKELEPESLNVYLSQFKDAMSFCETTKTTTD